MTTTCPPRTAEALAYVFDYLERPETRGAVHAKANCHLAQVIQQRLGHLGSIIIEPQLDRATHVTLPDRPLILRPGGCHLEPYHHPPDFHPELLRLCHPEASPFDRPTDRAAFTAFTLHRQDYVLQHRLTVREPVPLTYDTSGSWKRHPPSHRRHMRSWQRATYQEKVRYAPLSRYQHHIPDWALHPQHRDLQPLGEVTIRSCFPLFAQAEDRDKATRLLEEHGRDLVHMLREALEWPTRTDCDHAVEEKIGVFVDGGIIELPSMDEKMASIMATRATDHD